MSLKAVPIVDTKSAAITAADRILIWLRAQNAEAANELFTQVAQAFDETTGTRQLQIAVYETLAQVILSLLLTAHSEGSITGLKSTESEEAQEVTKTYDEFCAEMEEALMALICAVEDDAKALTNIIDSLLEETHCPDVKLRTLMYTFNSQPQGSALKPMLFTKIVTFAADSKLLDLAVVPVLKRAGSWPEAWGISASEKRQVYRCVAEKLKGIEQTQMALDWNRRALSTYDTEKALDGDAETLAAECLRDSIASPTEFYFDEILKLKAVAALEKSKTHSGLYQLAQVLLAGTVQQMSDLFKSQPKLCSTYKLKEQDLLKKIRVIAVASEALKSQNNCGTSETLFSRRTLKLEDLAKVVGLSEEETEDACVSGVGHGLFVAKIDQLNKTIDIDSAMCRQFVKEDWQMLKGRLEQWQSGVNDMCQLLGV